MTFSDDLAAFRRKLERREAFVYDRATELARESVIEGSVITGSPGQPVITGEFKATFTVTRLGPRSIVISTPDPEAQFIEDGMSSTGQPIVFVATHGGAHSMKLTRLGWQKLVDAAAAEVTRN